MIWSPVLAISVGAAAGALLRWQLNVQMNSLFPVLPLGTLVANLVGGYIIGLAIAYFARAPGIAPEWRLLIITGFCGGLTTFSTFSAEVVTRLQEGRMGLGHGHDRDPRCRIASDDPGRARHRAPAGILVRRKP